MPNPSSPPPAETNETPKIFEKLNGIYDRYSDENQGRLVNLMNLSGNIGALNEIVDVFLSIESDVERFDFLEIVLMNWVTEKKKGFGLDVNDYVRRLVNKITVLISLRHDEIKKTVREYFLETDDATSSDETATPKDTAKAVREEAGNLLDPDTDAKIDQ